jgi:hypothetical protein
MRASSPSVRRARAVESFRSAADALGPLPPGDAVFCLTRGQFSMIDAVLHTLDVLGPAHVSLWTWTIADYEVQAFTSMRSDARIMSGRLIIDSGARSKNAPLLSAWWSTFGPESIRYVLTHAKIARVWTPTRKVLLRGSMNLNHNPRFEQLDATCDGPDFDLVAQVEDELPVLPDDHAGRDAYAASRVAEAFAPEQLACFSRLRRWAK